MHPILFFLTLFLFVHCQSPSSSHPPQSDEVIDSVGTLRVGAERVHAYLDHLQNKSVGLLVNHSSLVGSTHLLDTLTALNIDIPKVFTPEHGFTGKADAGEAVASEKGSAFELISLFGEKRRPDLSDLDGLDVVVFDIQDVGTRFYTYISTMHYMMEACARRDIPFVVLDRPNPNGSYVDGPFLAPQQRSFVGLHPIPIVHGLTVGELAKMIVGEGWLADSLALDLTVVPMQGWTHSDPYDLPVKPSPNLPNARSIALYPGLCLFEGTILSVGRGTATPFQHIGHPDYPDTTYSFIPESMEGAKNPKYEGQVCYGLSFQQTPIRYAFSIRELIDTYQKMGRPKNFFNRYFFKLGGDLGDQIEAGWSEEKIRASWQPALEEFRLKRAKYLLYAE